MQNSRKQKPKFSVFDKYRLAFAEKSLHSVEIFNIGNFLIACGRYWYLMISQVQRLIEIDYILL